jgi:hypothetical protein
LKFERRSLGHQADINLQSQLLTGRILMTKYDKINLIIAIIGVVVAILSPFITYHWLDPQLQSFAHRPRFQISAIEKTGTRKVSELKVGKDMDFDKALKAWAEDFDNVTYDVAIVNVGELPAKDALITTQYRPFSQPDTSSISPTFNPPMPVEISNKVDTQFITIKRPIGPHEKIDISFPRKPKAIYASTTEFGDSTIFLPQSNIPSVVIWDKPK